MKNPNRILSLITTSVLVTGAITEIQAADTVRFRLRFVTAAENAGNVSLDVVRTAGSTNLATVDYATFPFTATAGVDYQSASGQLTFQPGETNKTISVNLLDDPAQEGAESFNVLLSNPVGAGLGGAATNANVNIDDNEKPFLLDPEFDPAGGVGGTTDRVLPLPDGKVLITGSFTEYQGLTRNGLARLNADGSIDPAYDARLAGGDLFPTGVSRWSQAPDGKLVVYGFFRTAGGQPRNRLARLNPDGSLDASFDPGNWLPNGSFVVGTVIAQPDGKVIICGFFTTIHGQPRNHIARLNADGSLDTTFDAGAASGANTGVVDAVLQGNGKFVVCGSFTNFAGVARSYVARLNPDGSLDAGYAPVAKGFRVISFQPFFIRRLALRADGKLFIQGDGLEEVNGTPRRGFALLNEDGSLDPSFVPGNLNFVLLNWFTALPNGGVLAAGSLSTAANGSYAFVRLRADGTFDTAFDTDVGNNGVDAQVTADGKYIVTGFWSEISGAARPGLARLFPDGGVRKGFNFVGTGGSTNESAGSILVTVQRRGETSGSLTVNVPLIDATASAGSDYRPLAGAVTFGPLETRKAVVVPLISDGASEPEENFGASLSSSTSGVLIGRSSNTLWILDDDRVGSVDPAFRFTVAGLGIPFLTDASAVTPLPGGQFLAAVFGFDPVTFESSGVVARFNSDGSPDLSFPPYALSIFTGSSQITLMSSCGGYLVNAGDRLVLLRSDGAEDSAFSVTVAPADENDFAFISDVVVQSDQNIVVAGHFSSVNGVPRKNIARVRVTGDVDIGFDPGAGPDDTVAEVALQPNGKLVIGGWFFNVGSEARLFLARLNADGSLDLSLDPRDSFTDPFGGLPTIQTINVQPDGRILVGGTFDSYQGTPRFSLARLMPDGALDNTFDIGTGFIQSDPATPGFIAGTALQPDGKVLVTGSYSAFNGTRAAGIVRINSSGSLDPEFQLTGTALLRPFDNVYVGSPAVLLPTGNLLIPAFGGNNLFNLNGVVRLNGEPDKPDTQDEQDKKDKKVKKDKKDKKGKE